MTPPRRAKLVLLVLAFALVWLGVWAWLDEGPLWRWVMTDRVYVVDRPPGYSPRRGWETVSRWSGEKHGRRVMFDPRTGWKIQEDRFADGVQLEISLWNGASLVRQAWRDDFGTKVAGSGVRTKKKTSPPWLWGVTDQTEPAMPAWMKDDALWQAALDAQE